MRLIKERNPDGGLANFRPKLPGKDKDCSETRKRTVIVWMIGLVCVVGATYQTFISLQNFFTYPSVVSSTLEKEAAEFPAVTICPENWYNMSQVCHWWPKNCTRKDVVSSLLNLAFGCTIFTFKFLPHTSAALSLFRGEGDFVDRIQGVRAADPEQVLQMRNDQPERDMSKLQLRRLVSLRAMARTFVSPVFFNVICGLRRSLGPS